MDVRSVHASPSWRLVASDDPEFVSGFEGFGNLLRYGQCFVERDRSTRDAIGEGRPLDQFHHEGLHTV
jgi:hypothetical protein